MVLAGEIEVLLDCELIHFTSPLHPLSSIVWQGGSSGPPHHCIEPAAKLRSHDGHGGFGRR
jgi:hypothetical protein